MKLLPLASFEVDKKSFKNKNSIGF